LWWWCLWHYGGSAYGWVAILDGLEVAHSTQDFWAPDQGDVVLGGIQLNKGAHELLIYGWEYCCDGDASGKLQPGAFHLVLYSLSPIAGITFSRDGSTPMPATAANFQAAVFGSDFVGCFSAPSYHKPVITQGIVVVGNSRRPTKTVHVSVALSGSARISVQVTYSGACGSRF
jgi:hypothetical protein